MKNALFIKSTPSTNDLLKNLARNTDYPEGFCLHTDFQTAGKGQQGNKWESQKGKNLLFSKIIYPSHISIDGQFIISQLISLALKKTLDKYTEHITIKWPNDIYWKDEKIGGILIENSLQGSAIRYSVMGVGLNINQTEFSENIPNPVSLKQITRKTYRRKPILKDIRENFMKMYREISPESVKAEYAESLYHKDGFHPYILPNDESFSAKIVCVKDDGQLILETSAGEIKGFYFKEVQFVIS